MPNQSSKKKRKDEVEQARSIIDRFLEKYDPQSPELVNSSENQKGDEAMEQKKNPAAVALGRLGGKKGGPARAAKLSEKRRKAIAKKAAQARWSKAKKG